jgi:hypothetical protein
MNEQFKNKIIDDIKQTGFPVELKAASMLERSEWRIIQNSTYVDYDHTKSREIDITARRLFHGRTDNTLFVINLIIEVKKSEKRPWIFFTTPNTRPPYQTFLGPSYGQIIHTTNFNAKNLSPKDFMIDFPRNQESEVSTSFYEAFKSPDEPSKIYEAVLSATKAAVYEKRMESGEHFLSQSEIESNAKKEYRKDLPESLDVFIPIVILDGTMCKAKISDDDQISIEQCSYIPLVFSHSSNIYEYYLSFYPEVMTIDYFEKFLLDINRWGESVIDLWRK